MNQRDVAKLAGVSSATVSRVINKDQSVLDKTFNRVTEVINNYGYVQNAVARNLRISKTKTIGYLVPDIGNPFFPAVLGGIEVACHKKDYDIIFENTDENKAKEKKAIDTLLRYRVDGIIAIFVDGDNEDIKRIRKMGIPMVHIDRKSEVAKDFDYVGIDNIGGMKQIVDYLSSLGHKKIAIIYGPENITPGYERLKGFKEAMKQAKLTVNEEYMVNGSFTEEGSYKCVGKLLSMKDTPTAIITANNLMSIGAYKALVDLKIDIPNEISLVGFDDFDFAAYLIPPITVINRPTWEMGKVGAELLLEKIENGSEEKAVKKIIMATNLCIRNSCAKISN